MKFTKTAKNEWTTTDNRFEIKDFKGDAEGLQVRVWDYNDQTCYWFESVALAKQYIKSCY